MVKSKLVGLKKRFSTIELGGGEFRLRYDLNALCLIEEQIDDIVQILAGDLRSVRFALWAGLQAAHPELSLEEVGGLVDVSEISRIARTINSAMLDAMPEEDRKKAEALLAAAREVAEKQLIGGLSGSAFVPPGSTKKSSGPQRRAK